MSWTKLDDQFFTHPKVLDLPKDAKLLFLASLTYCASQLTDGHITQGALRVIAAMVDAPREEADTLVSAGLWEACEGGWAIHDYLEYQPARDKALAIKQARAEAGSRGGQKSGESRAEANTQAKPEANTQAKPEANTQAKPEQTDGQNGKPNPTPSPSLSRPESDPVPDQESPPSPPTRGVAAGQPSVPNPSSVPNGVAVFVEAFQDKFPGECPDLLPKHTKGLEEALGRMGAETYSKAVAGFFSDPWPSERGYSVVTFLSQGADRWLRAQPRAPTARAPNPNSASLGEQSQARAAAFANMTQKPHDPEISRIEEPLP